MDLSSTTAVIPARDLDRARDFYTSKLGLTATQGVVGLTISGGSSRFFVYPAEGASSGDFTQAALHVADVVATVKELRARNVVFEEYDGPVVKTVDGIARMPDGDDAAWFKDSEGNLLVIVPAR